MHFFTFSRLSRCDFVFNTLSIIALESLSHVIMACLFPLLDVTGNLPVWSLQILCENLINFIECSHSLNCFLLSLELFVMSGLVHLEVLKSACMCPFSFSGDH